ncbi:MAG: hypothetical protein ACXW3K_01965 [Brevundimonas sp.]
MTETRTPLTTSEALLKQINDKLVWVIILLALVMLNTCSLGDDLSDAARDLRKSSQPPAAAEKG